jgi:uncharacterized membrane protein
MSAYITAALVLGWAVPRISKGPLALASRDFGRDQVIAFLSAVSTGMMAFTGIVFAFLFILLQFGSTAYTPHIVAMLWRAPVLTHAHGVFTGTFLYALMALRGVGAAGGRTTDVTVWTAFIWLLASVVLLLRLRGVFGKLAITDILDMLGEKGHRAIEDAYGAYTTDDPRAAPRPAPATQSILHRGAPSYVLWVDVGTLVTLAGAANAVIRVHVAIGDSVTAATPLAVVEGGTVPEARLRAAIAIGRDRSLERSPAHALRLLVDIAIRSLSPGINDPTSAVRALDHIEALLRLLGASRLAPGVAHDPAGTPRVVYATPSWEEYLDLGLTEIQCYGMTSVQVERRLAALLSHLRTTLPESRRAAVDALAEEHRAAIHRTFPAGPLRERAEGVDRQGLGHSSTNGGVSADTP